MGALRFCEFYAIGCSGLQHNTIVNLSSVRPALIAPVSRHSLMVVYVGYTPTRLLSHRPFGESLHFRTSDSYGV